MSNEHEYHIDILYGSETGTAEELAFKVHAILHRLPISSKVQCMDDYDVNNLEFGTIIFITSTTGEGAVPANMSKFWKYLLRKNLPTNMLERLNFAVFGLGDSSYEIFNAAAR
jgi:sulfite reductase alpha subunit-like flavoprotein